MDTNKIILPTTNETPSVTLMGNSLAMDLIQNNLKAERTRARVNGAVIIFLMAAWVFSMYMIFSYFANSVTVTTGDTNQSVSDISGNSNTIDQRG